MPDHSSDTTERAGAVRSRRAHRARPTDWRLGGPTTQGWREGLLAVALMGLGLGMLAGIGAQQLGAPPAVSQLLLWLGMLVAVVIGFARSRPAGLLRVRPVDVLWAIGLGLALRLAQGWIAAAGGDTGLPALTTVDGHLPGTWWFDGLIAPVLLAPAIEELFFRAVVLIALYTMLRRPFGGLAAGTVALLVSTALFVAVHALGGTLEVADLTSLGALGLVCGLLVLLTGRLAPALGVHIIYNALGVALALIGTL